jgi:hypothetical protein
MYDKSLLKVLFVQVMVPTSLGGLYSWKSLGCGMIIVCCAVPRVAAAEHSAVPGSPTSGRMESTNHSKRDNKDTKVRK